MSHQNVHTLAKACLSQTEPEKKVALAFELFELWQSKQLSKDDISVQRLEVPGRPDKPELVAPRDLVKRNANTPEGKAALIHSLAHIEFNAINLALDAVYRFQGQPDEWQFEES